MNAVQLGAEKIFPQKFSATSGRSKNFSRNKSLPPDLLEAVNDVRERKNLHGPFESPEDAVKSILED